MNLTSFLKHEIKDRLSQKGIGVRSWNFVMFPVTVTSNYINYRKWCKLLRKIEVDESELKKLIQIKIIEENIPARIIFNKLDGLEQPILRMNKGYILDQGELYIFPIFSPESTNHFYTEIQEPLVISFNNSRHPFQTLWNVSTLKSIDSIDFQDDLTIINLRGEKFENKIRVKIYKTLKLSAWKS